MTSNTYDMFEEHERGLSYTERFKNALKYDDQELVKIFLRRYHSDGAHDNMGLTPLHLAAKYGSEKCALLIIDDGHYVNDKDVSSTTPLILALQYEKSKVTQILLDQGASCLLRDPYYAESALNRINNAYYNRKIIGALIRAMIKENISIDDIYDRLVICGQDSYHAVVSSDSEELVRLLDSNKKNSENSRKKILVDKDDINIGMRAAIDDKNVKIIKLMHELGVKIDVKIKYGHNLLTYAASQLIPDEKYVDVIRILLQLRVNINEICDGLNAVQWIAKCGNLEALRLVLSYGANINVVDAQGNTLLHLAVYNRDLDVLIFLNRMGLRRCAKNSNDNIAIDLAEKLKNTEAVLYLNQWPHTDLQCVIHDSPCEMITEKISDFFP